MTYLVGYGPHNNDRSAIELACQFARAGDPDLAFFDPRVVPGDCGTFLVVDDTLFAPGDDRVASLFLWHFVEEVEHRSSALIIYDAVAADPWYRMRVAPSIFRHVWAVLRIACEGFNKHVPLEDRKIDALSMFGMQARKKALLQRLSFIDAPYDGPIENAFSQLPIREVMVAMSGAVRSQIPGHNPAHEKLPALADEWFARYEAGYEVTQWYTADRAGRVGV